MAEEEHRTSLGRYTENELKAELERRVARRALDYAKADLYRIRTSPELTADVLVPARKLASLLLLTAEGVSNMAAWSDITEIVREASRG